MGIEFWHIWTIIAIIFFIIEVFTSGFLIACFGIGCVVAGVIAGFGFGLNIQIIGFSVGTLLSFLLIRPLMTKWLNRKSDEVKMNADALVGAIGVVTVEIDNIKNTGRVRVQGDDWKAENLTNEVLNVGTKIEVVEVKSTVLIVKPFR